jgi:hypothetical protein
MGQNRAAPLGHAVDLGLAYRKPRRHRGPGDDGGDGKHSLTPHTGEDDVSFQADSAPVFREYVTLSGFPLFCKLYFCRRAFVKYGLAEPPNRLVMRIGSGRGISNAVDEFIPFPLPQVQNRSSFVNASGI